MEDPIEIANKVFAIMMLMKKIDLSLGAGQPIIIEFGEENNTLINILTTHYEFLPVGEDSIEILSLKKHSDREELREEPQA